MRRRQLFEWNDQPRVPAALRDAIVESLSLLLRWGRMLRGLVEPFERFCARCGHDEVLDLCSGAGGPAAILIDEIRATDRQPPRFVLTDLFPRPELWTDAQRPRADVLTFHAAPVDATAIPPDVARGRPRVIMNSFHHFEPAVAAAILEDAVRAGAGVLVAEVFDRNPLRMLSIAPAGLPAVLASPVLAPRRRLLRALFTWLLPIVPIAGTWDGIVSTLRVYEEAELRAMVAPFGGDYDWEWGTYRFWPLGKGTYFFGTPRRSNATAA